MIRTDDTRISISRDKLLIFDYDGGVEHVEHDFKEHSCAGLVLIVCVDTEEEVPKGGIGPGSLWRFFIYFNINFITLARRSGVHNEMAQKWPLVDGKKLLNE